MKEPKTLQDIERMARQQYIKRSIPAPVDCTYTPIHICARPLPVHTCASSKLIHTLAKRIGQS